MKKKPSRKAKPSKVVKKEQALTKKQLVKLYEEFKEKKREEYEEHRKNYQSNMMYRLRDKLSEYKYPYHNAKLPKWIKGEDFNKAYLAIYDGVPTYTEPTFNEFMESLKEEKKHKYINIFSGVSLKPSDFAGMNRCQN